MKDPITTQRVNELHPRAIPVFTDFINECESTLNTTFRVTMGLRTIDEQNKLYAQGRTVPGQIVTNAPGGTSYHNYGLAVDICELVNGQPDWNFDTSKLQGIATKYGLEWGGNWVHLKDRPHFELRLGFAENCSDLMAAVKAGNVDENGFVNV